MRPWLLAITCVGCGFDLRPAGAPGDAAATGDARPVDAAFDATLPPPPACVTNGAYADGGPQAGHRYRVTSSLDFDGAVERCASEGAHLVQIDDAAENAHIDQLLDGSDGWIGLHDLEREGAFGWVTRSPGMFRAFGQGEPNDNSFEDCVYMRSDGLWNDSSCEGGFLTVCECDPAYVAPAVAACRALPNPTLIDGRRYFIDETTRSWPEAVAACSMIGAYLAVPGDDNENGRLDNSFPGESWIGYADQNVDGTLEWVNGATPGYTRWGPGQPSIGVDELCVAIAFVNPSSSWDDTTCSTPRRFACECEPLVR